MKKIFVIPSLVDWLRSSHSPVHYNSRRRSFFTITDSGSNPFDALLEVLPPIVERVPTAPITSTAVCSLNMERTESVDFFLPLSDTVAFDRGVFLSETYDTASVSLEEFRGSMQSVSLIISQHARHP